MSSKISGPLEAELTADPPNVAPGVTTTLTLVLKNKGSAPVSLGLMVAHATRPPIHVRDAQGKTIAPPEGKPTLKSNPMCAAVDCAFVSMQATIGPGGRATWKIPWKASKLAWPKGPVLQQCCESGVDPIVTGPLAAGSYEVSIDLHGNPKVAASTKVTVGP